MAKIVAVANQKGGVGKTTTAVNLSSCVAALGKKVLIVDLDPQGNTTTGYGIPKRSVELGTYEMLIGEAEPKDVIRKTEFRTDVIGSNTRLAGAGLEMIDLPGRESRLRKALAKVQQDYDFIFIDCPPSLDLLTLNGLCACDSVLIPIQCEYYALEGLSELISTLKTIRKKYNPYLDIEGVVFTMFSERLNLTMQVVDQVKKYCAGLLGWKRSTVSVIVYILLGMVGLPIFTGFKSGVAAITGPTGGYIVGFVLTALITGALVQKFGHKFWQLILFMVIGLQEERRQEPEHRDFRSSRCQRK